MICCEECIIPTQENITTYIFLSQKTESIVQNINNKKNLHLAKLKQKKQFRYKQLLHLNNQNERLNDNGQQLRMTNNFCQQGNISAESFLIIDNLDGVDTGRFVNKKQPYDKKIYDSQTKRVLASKTTSFGSIKSRNSSVMFCKSRQLEIMQNELDKLQQEQHKYRRTKLDKQFAYKAEMLKINHFKDELKKKGRQRQIELLQLKEFILKKNQKKKQNISQLFIIVIFVLIFLFLIILTKIN